MYFLKDLYKMIETPKKTRL